MLIAPKKGFVFLAVTKSASTSIEHAFRQYSDGSLQANPFKHTRYDQFQRHLQPFLAAKGFHRASYDVVCVVREPIDWLFSWWRYRTREELASRKRRSKYAGKTTFDQFAQAYMSHHRGDDKGSASFAQVGRPSKFMQPLPGKPEIDRIFRYERLDLLVDFLCDKVGKKVEIGVENVSPERTFELSEEVERELRAFFEPEYRVYEGAIGA